MDNTKLQEYFDFTTSDLDENRKGRLSERQITRQKKQKGMIRNIILIFGIICFGIALGVVVSAVTSITNHGTGVVIIIPALIGVIVLGGFGIWSIRYYLTAVPEYILKKTQGRINITRVQSPVDSITHEMCVGKVQFDLDSMLAGVKFDLADYIEQDNVYAVYYLDDTLNVMSMEWVAKQE